MNHHCDTCGWQGNSDRPIVFHRCTPPHPTHRRHLVVGTPTVEELVADLARKWAEGWGDRP